MTTETKKNDPQSLMKALQDRLSAEKVIVADLSSGCGSKFHVLVVSKKFDSVKLLDRHRMVNEALTEELKTIHALQIKAWTPTEYPTKKDTLPAELRE